MNPIKENSPAEDKLLDAIIVGAGPAGLSAALILGRCRRKVMVFDTGVHRNAVSHALHGYLSRDGIGPLELLLIAREQMQPYDSVRFENVAVVDARVIPQGFEVTAQDGRKFACRKLLLATGVKDDLPPIDHITDYYGRSIFHCPYCDGWELRDKPLAIYGQGENGTGLALELTAWSRDLVLCTDGEGTLSETELARLKVHSVEVRQQKIAGLEGEGGSLQKINFVDGSSVARSGMFFSTGEKQHSDLAHRLGCVFCDKGTVETGQYQATNVPNLFVAGDACKAVQLVIIAASEGAQAGFAINTSLLKEDLAAVEGKSD